MQFTISFICRTMPKRLIFPAKKRTVCWSVLTAQAQLSWSHLQRSVVWLISTAVTEARHKLTRKATQPNEVENDAYTRTPNLSSTSCDLDLWPPDPKVDRFMSLSRGQLAPIGIKIGSFAYKILCSQTSEGMDAGSTRTKCLQRTVWPGRARGINII